MPKNLSKITTAQLEEELRNREKSGKKSARNESGKASKRGTSKKRKVKKSEKVSRKERLEEEKRDQYRLERRAARKKMAKAFEKEYEDEFRVMSKKTIGALKDSVKNQVYKLNYMPVTESTVPYLSEKLYQLAKSQIHEMKKKYPLGANIYMKVLMESDKSDPNDVRASFVVKMSDVSYHTIRQDIRRRMFEKSNKLYATEDYRLVLSEAMILVSGFGKYGGCETSNTKKTREFVDKETTIVYTSHKSIGNNCLIQCFNHAYGLSGREVKASKVRAALKLEKDEKIHMNKIRAMSNYYNTTYRRKMGYILMNQNHKIVKFNHPTIEKVEDYNMADVDNRKNIVHLCLKNNHYFTYDILTYRSCTGCGEKLRSDNETHKCTKERMSFYNTKITEKKDMVRSVKIEEPKIDYNQIVHWDLETFQPTDGVRHEVYASGFYDHKYKMYYGKDASKKTIDCFMKFENRTISAYNGSGFDYSFLIDSLTQQGASVENMIMNNGRLMSFTYHNGDPTKKNKIFDLFLFTMTGLSTACEDFKVSSENSKGEFDHSKMKTWDDVEKYKHEVIPYLEKDVMGLKELFEKFNDMIFELEKTNITRFMTCSHMGYTIWQKLNKEIIEIPKCLVKMDFIAKSVYGGRCYPHQQLYTSSMYDDVQSGKLKYADVIKSKSKDFIFNADASSLYPASMSGFDHMKVKYPIGYSHWSEEPEKEYNAGKMGFYEIDFTPPRDIRIPILPRRKIVNEVNLGVIWSLENGSGIYTSIDILNAIEAGYEVKFKGKALVYNESGDVFKTYIKRFYKLKGKAEKEGNDSMRGIAKLMLNSLYGKMLMSPVDTHTEIINNAIQFNDFLRKYNMTDYSIINGGKILISGSVKGERRVEKINKPRQLGAFVTAYSRRIMLFYMKEIDPSLKSSIFTYTDTDSLHISGKAYYQLMKKGLIKTKAEAELGYLCSDIKNEGVILKEINLAPKTYMYESIGNKEDIKTTMKCKGIPKKHLQVLDYENHGRKIEFFGLKKKNAKLTKADREKGIGHFSVCNNTQTRTFMKNTWKNMIYSENEYFPIGYEGEDLVREESE